MKNASPHIQQQSERALQRFTAWQPLPACHRADHVKDATRYATAVQFVLESTLNTLIDLQRPGADLADRVRRFKHTEAFGRTALKTGSRLLDLPGPVEQEVMHTIHLEMRTRRHTRLGWAVRAYEESHGTCRLVCDQDTHAADGEHGRPMLPTAAIHLRASLNRRSGHQAGTDYWLLLSLLTDTITELCWDTHENLNEHDKATLAQRLVCTQNQMLELDIHADALTTSNAVDADDAFTALSALAQPTLTEAIDQTRRALAALTNAQVKTETGPTHVMSEAVPQRLPAHPKSADTDPATPPRATQPNVRKHT